MPPRIAAALLAATAALALPAARAHAAGWAPFTRVTTAPFLDPAGVAVGPDGTVTAAFRRKDASNGGSNLEVKVRSPGGLFGPSQQLTTSGTAGSPQMARDAQGNVALVWSEYLSCTQVVRGATKPAGGAFTAAQTIADTGSNAHNARVDIAGGTAVATWVQNGRVRAATAQAGASFQVHDPLSGVVETTGAPVVAVASGGAAVVAWATYSPTSGARSIQAAARSAGSQFGPLPDVAHPASLADLQIAMSTEGRATLAWQYWDDDAGNRVIQAASRGKTGDFGGVETVDTISWAYDTLALDTAPDGTSLLAWPDGGQLRYAVRPEGGGFGATHTVPGSHAADSIPQLAFGADGTAWAAWRGSWTGPIRVETARIAADGSSTSAEDVAAPANPGLSDSATGFYDIDADAHGNAAVAWSHNVAANGPGHQAVDLRVFDAEPPALTSVQVPATALTGQQVIMSAAASDALSPVTIRWTLSHKLPGGQGQTIVRKFDSPGTYLVLVEAVDGAGNSVKQSREIQVSADPNPTIPCPDGQICE
jgi:hypothetical protein